MADLLIWYIWVQVFSLCGWWVASHWLRQLPDRGYGISKALGVLLGGFAYWMVVSLGLSKNEPGAILLALALVALMGLLLRQVRRVSTTGAAPLPPLRPSAIIAAEVLFALAFVACAVYRAYNPEIVEAGGEKYMESMYLNAILRSPTFPPNDAWLAGFAISYYYFGYILLAMLTKISGVAPSIAFNLGGATLFALTLVSASSVGYNLWSIYERHMAARATPTLRVHVRAWMAGLLTAIMLGVMGNLGGFMESVRCTNVLPTSFWAWLDVRHIEAKPMECKGVLPTRFYWWWDWSRVIHDYTPTGADQEVITETPAFSFILGDNHPHVMNLPFVLLTMTLALYYLTLPGPTPSDSSTADQTGSAPASRFARLRLDHQPLSNWLADRAPDLLLTAIIVGGLSFMNTWDFPVYGSLVVGALLLRRWYQHEPLLPGLVFGALVFLLGYLLYVPFYATFASQARGIGINLFNGTRFVQFALMFAPFVVAAPFFIAHAARLNGVTRKTLLARSSGLTVAGVAIALVAMVALGLISAQGRAYAAEMASSGTVMGVTRDTVTQRLTERLLAPWTPLFLLAMAACCAVLILTRPTRVLATPASSTQDTSGPALIRAFVLLLFLGGALLTAATEFIFLQDLFGTRMNTVFKFYYQAWTVWAVAGAFALMALLNTKGWFAGIGAGLVSVLVSAGLLFPIFASLSKTSNFSAQPTLDGAAYLQRAKPEDAALINWLNQHVSGDPTTVEAPADPYAAYVYNGRIAAFTGLPTLLGWGGHEHQWRGNYTEPARREPLIQTLFSTTNPDEAQAILHEFNVRYVIVGQVERVKYGAEGLSKFDSMCRTAFQSGDSRIYECNP
jgi:YYY domain-containing protein